MCGVRYKTVHLCNNLQSYLSWLSHKQLDCVTVHNGVEMLVSQQDSGNKLDVGGGPSKARWEMAYVQWHEHDTPQNSLSWYKRWNVWKGIWNLEASLQLSSPNTMEAFHLRHLTFWRSNELVWNNSSDKVIVNIWIHILNAYYASGYIIAMVAYATRPP